MNKKRILVLLSSYNGEKFISQQLDSILNQKTEHTVDILIRDDGSKDTTIEILEKYKDKYPQRINIQKGENVGYIKSFFILIKEANGYDYYALSDQDDVWLENKIDDAVNKLEVENNDIPLLYACPSYLVHDDMVPYGVTQIQRREITLYNAIIQNFCPGHNQVINNALLQELKKPIDYNEIFVHDAWITCVAALKGKIVFENECHTYYRQHNNNEIGYGQSRFSWIKERIRRVNNNDTKKQSRQINSFRKMYYKEFDKSFAKEIDDFFLCQNSFFKRMTYVITTKLYRQKKIETVMFKVLVLLGKYKVSN